MKLAVLAFLAGAAVGIPAGPVLAYWLLRARAHQDQAEALRAFGRMVRVASRG